MLRQIAKTGLAAAALACGGLASPALAADLPVKAPVSRAVAPFTWTGLYLGGSVGGRWADVDGTTVSVISPLGGVFPPFFPAAATGSYDSATFRGGVYFGYNWQVAPQWLVGIEGDLAWGRGEESLSFIPGITPPGGAGDSSSFRHTWDAGVRARLGYLITPDWLIYVTGGAQWQHVEASLACGAASCPAVVLGGLVVGGAFAGTAETTRTGWTLGGGIETRLWGNWLARAEYRYADFGTWRVSYGAFPTIGVNVHYTIRTHTALLGLAYRF
jgi:outer membrane immunogenic protein